jgi:hypothetical protein
VSRRVLIVTGSYAPAMIADMHRARHLAWELPKLGWDVEILAPDSSYQEACCLDDDSDAFFAPGTKATFVPAFLPKLLLILGVGSIGWRSLVPMWRAGRGILKTGSFDLVYLSTTQFPLLLLGALWRRELGVPYVLDFHDPCHKDAGKYRAWLRPELKHVLARQLSQFVEARAVAASSGIVSVSPAYLDDLRRRYSGAKPAWTRTGRARVIPFAVSPFDLETVARNPKASAAAATRPRIVYVGAGGAIMRRSFSLICRALACLRGSGRMPLGAIAIELYGTLRNWREGGPKDLAELAAEHGVGDLVDERPAWISYRHSLEILQDGDGALILGVDDAGYMPSKLFTYAYSRKPLLASLRSDGPAYAEFQGNPRLGHALWFSEAEDMPLSAAATVVEQFLQEVRRKDEIDRNAVLEPFLAQAMAVRHAALFDLVLDSNVAGAT